jgi:prepilin-type processing-associated H-X9-DG protein
MDDTTWPTSTVLAITSYVMNGAFCDFGSTHMRITQFHPDDVVFYEIPGYGGGGVSVNDPSNWPPEGVAARHNNSTSVGYIDGHAEMMLDTEFNAECQTGPSHLWCDPLRPQGGIKTYNGGVIPNPIPTYY